MEARLADSVRATTRSTPACASAQARGLVPPRRVAEVAVLLADAVAELDLAALVRRAKKARAADDLAVADHHPGPEAEQGRVAPQPRFVQIEQLL